MGFACLLWLAAGVAGQPVIPHSLGLPPELPAALKELDGYEDFPAIYDFTPIAVHGDIVLDGRQTDSDAAFALFEDDHGLWLPPRGRILRLFSGTAAERWEYPVGTRLLHRFYLKTEPRELFELRLIEKQPDGQWAFGSYVPSGPGRVRLILTPEPVRLAVMSDGRFHRLSARRLHPQGCRLCHQLHSFNLYPEGDPGGPCGFGPGNPALKAGPASAWALRFERDPRHRYNPFLN